MALVGAFRLSGLAARWRRSLIHATRFERLPRGRPFLTDCGTASPCFFGLVRDPTRKAKKMQRHEILEIAALELHAAGVGRQQLADESRDADEAKVLAEEASALFDASAAASVLGAELVADAVRVA